MNTQRTRHPRFARTLALASILVLALTGSQNAAFYPVEDATHWSKVVSPGPIVGVSVSTLKVQGIPPVELEQVEPVVNVPLGLSLKQARNMWKEMGSPLPSEIVTEAPYVGAPRDAVVDFARNFKGVPYVFTGSTPYGFDCSGYIRFIYSHFGVLLPHGVGGQADFGTHIKAKHAKPGDLVIWNDRSHSGIYAGNGRIIHATKPGHSVTEVDLYTERVFYVRLPVGTSK